MITAIFFKTTGSFHMKKKPFFYTALLAVLSLAACHQDKSESAASAASTASAPAVQVCEHPELAQQIKQSMVQTIGQNDRLMQSANANWLDAAQLTAIANKLDITIDPAQPICCRQTERCCLWFCR